MDSTVFDIASHVVGAELSNGLRNETENKLVSQFINKKLIFTLCFKCASEQKNNFNCTHSEEERTLNGTWVSLEIDKVCVVLASVDVRMFVILFRRFLLLVVFVHL